MLVALIGAALLLAACGSNPNEHVQSNELFRPAALSEAATAETDSQEGQQIVQQQEQSEQPAQQQGQQEASHEQQADEPEQQAEAEQSDDEQEDEPAAPLETSDDVIRRYGNPSYGYSFELVCSPFCDPNSNGIDRVSFLSETGRALIGVDVVPDDGSDLGALVRSVAAIPDATEFSARTQTATVTGEAAERFDWDEDRRATGGFQVRWHALAVRVGDVVVLLRAGGVLEDYEAVSAALERALGSFILPLELGATPGVYQRFDFSISYDPADVAQEFGQPTSNPPSDESGIFVLQTTTALRAVLTWQTLGAAFYDGDAAIQQSLRDSLGVENVTGMSDWGEVDGQPARTGGTETQFGEGLVQIQSYAWYCPESGREFALHVLDPDDPAAVAVPLLESFRCLVSE